MDDGAEGRRPRDDGRLGTGDQRLRLATLTGDSDFDWRLSIADFDWRLATGDFDWRL
jgi:hypothetical protein